MSTPLTSPAPKLATWLNLFDRLAQQTNPGEAASVTEEQFSTMCAIQGLAPTSEQVQAVLTHHRGEKQENPPVCHSPADFEPWLRPTMKVCEEARIRLAAETQARAGMRQKEIELIDKMTLISFGVGTFLSAPGLYIWLKPNVFWMNYVIGVMFGLVAGLSAALVAFLIAHMVIIPRRDRRHKRQHAMAISLKEEWAARGQDAEKDFSDYTPSTADLKRWLGCPAAVAALRWINQSQVPLLHIDVAPLNALVKAMEDQQQEQAGAQERAALLATWTDLVHSNGRTVML